MLIAAVCVRVVLGGRLLTVLKILADVTEGRRPRLSLCSVMLMHPFPPPWAATRLTRYPRILSFI